MLIAFHKPYRVLSQFNTNPDENNQRTLQGFDFPKNVIPLGRLDYDSEGLLLLSDEKELEHRLLHPKFQHRRRYLALVEGAPDQAALAELCAGTLEIKGHRCLPCQAEVLKKSPLPERNPPVRFLKNADDTWLRLELREGKNRQVRRMVAAIGHPCLRLFRETIGNFSIADLPAGQWRELTEAERLRVFAE